ncbi:MAG: hypothetical protein IPM16_15305 [Chloroflexi bacterium]|nr:hypothetical protein [Chloroflexota bacterium]
MPAMQGSRLTTWPVQRLRCAGAPKARRGVLREAQVQEPRGVHQHYRHVSAVVVQQGGALAVWPNPLARHEIPGDLSRM